MPSVGSRPLRAFGNQIAAASAFAVLAFALAGSAAAQVLYKWIDADGKTQYSDRPPKDYKGTVTRIEPDEQPTPVAPYRAPRAGVAAGEGGAPPLPDLAAGRRELRRKLEAAVAIARDKLATAKAALETAGTPQDDEHQVIQQRVDAASARPGPGSASTGGMLGSGGMFPGPARSNCTSAKGASGQVVTTCPAIVPNDAYYERVGKLEDDVRTAEEALAAAEQAYRRGVE
jgi:Domain of unknown function (DUF4124)